MPGTALLGAASHHVGTSAPGRGGDSCDMRSVGSTVPKTTLRPGEGFQSINQLGAGEGSKPTE